MRKLALLILLFVGTPAFAVICKTVDEQGNVSYSDTPEAECQNRVKLHGFTTYTPRPVQPARPLRPTSTDTADPDAPYTGMRILQPENGGTIRSNEGKVPVSVEMTPALRTGHRMRVYLDGVMIQPAFPSQSAMLSGVERGTHKVRVEIVSESDSVLARADDVGFTLRQAALGSSQGPSTQTESDDSPAESGTPPPPPSPSSNPNFSGGNSFQPNYAPR